LNWRALGLEFVEGEDQHEHGNADHNVNSRRRGVYASSLGVYHA